MSLRKDYHGTRGIGIGGIGCPCCNDHSSKGKKLTRHRWRRASKVNVRKALESYENGEMD